MYDILNQITPGISPLKIRETKRIIKGIVDTSITSSQAESVIVGIDDLTQIDLSSKPLAVAIGYKESILSKFGYGLFNDDLIIEDILFDNKHFNPDSMCIDRFKSIHCNRLMPVFKYVKNSSSSVADNSRLKAYIEQHNSIDKIISKNIEKTLKNVPIFPDHHSLIEAIKKVDDINKKSGILLKNIHSMSNVEIRNACIDIFQIDRIGAMKSTNFKRCVMYLDLMENYTIEKNQ